VSIIHPRGDPASRIWIILDHPFPSDIPKGYLFSGGMGYVFEKMLSEAGLNIFDVYICARRPDPDSPTLYATVDNAILNYMPPFILLVNEVGSYFFPEMRARSTKESYKTQLNKYVGSLMTCDRFPYPHYMMPIYGPDKCAQDWTERNVTTYIDFQKIKDEFNYWRATGKIQPLPERRLICHDNIDLCELLNHFERFSKAKYLSNDIETVYPKKDSKFYPHPGFAIVIGLADSRDFGVSFRLYRESLDECRILWRAYDNLISGATIIGQNFINFDTYYQRAIGFDIKPKQVEDTLIRHHILWPELSHKLQFMTRQYTRQPYYKDEGKHWNVKHMSSLMHYNALDATVTYEVFEGQEVEFNGRPHLR